MRPNRLSFNAIGECHFIFLIHWHSQSYEYHTILILSRLTNQCISVLLMVILATPLFVVSTSTPQWPSQLHWYFPLHHSPLPCFSDNRQTSMQEFPWKRDRQGFSNTTESDLDCTHKNLKIFCVQHYYEII